MTRVINSAVGCRYFPPGPQLPPQPLTGLLPILLLGEQSIENGHWPARGTSTVPIVSAHFRPPCVGEVYFLSLAALKACSQHTPVPNTCIAILRECSHGARTDRAPQPIESRRRPTSAASRNSEIPLHGHGPDTDPTGPARTRADFFCGETPLGPCGSGRARVVEFSYNWVDLLPVSSVRHVRCEQALTNAH